MPKSTKSDATLIAFLLGVIHGLAWLGSVLQWLIAVELVLLLIIMAAVPLVKKEARELDEILDFRSPTSDNKNQKERTPDERTLIHRKTS